MSTRRYVRVALASGAEFALALGVIATVAVAAGCSAPTQQPTVSSSGIESFDYLVSWQIEQATAGGASDAQIAVLQQAKQAGVMSHELAMEAARDFMQCLEDVGVRAELVPSDDVDDFPTIDYRIYSQELTVADQCDIKTYDFVDTVYQLQPGVQDHGRQVMADHSEDFIECFTAAGIEVPENVSDAVLAGAVFSASQGIEPFGDGMLPGGPIDCLTPYGLTDDDL